MRAVAAVGFLLMCLAWERTWAEESSPPSAAAASSTNLAVFARPLTGDLDGMITRHMVRVLVPSRRGVSQP